MGRYILNVDKYGRITLPVDERENRLPGDRLGVYVAVGSIPGNDHMLSSDDFKCLKLVTEDKYNELVEKTEALSDEKLKKDMHAWFKRYATLLTVDSRGRITLPKSFLKEVLNFDPPGQVVFMVFPDEARLTTFAIHDEACRRAEKELMNNPVAIEDLGL